MKRIFTVAVFLLMTPLLIHGQLPLKEKRQLKKMYNQGVERILGGDYMGAVNAFTGCLDIDETYAPAYLERGKARIELDQPDRALSDFDNAIMFDTGLGEAYFYKGYLLFGDDTSGMDRNYLELSLENGFEIAQTHYYLGLSHLLEGNDDKALIAFDKAIRMKDDYALAYHDRAGIKRRLGDYNGALYDYKSAVNYMTDFPLAYSNMGSLKIILGDYEGAMEDFETAMEQDPDLALAYNNRGYAYYQLGETEKAIADFSAAIDKAGDFMEARLNMAVSHASQDELDMALGKMNEVISDYPQEGLLYLNRGLMKELRGDVIGACEDWAIALELGEEEAEAYLKECK